MWQKIIYPFGGKYPHEIVDVTDEVVDVTDEAEGVEYVEPIIGELWF